jgi:hypothetical protein
VGDDVQIHASGLEQFSPQRWAHQIFLC